MVSSFLLSSFGLVWHLEEISLSWIISLESYRTKQEERKNGQQKTDCYWITVFICTSVKSLFAAQIWSTEHVSLRMRPHLLLSCSVALVFCWTVSLDTKTGGAAGRAGAVCVLLAGVSSSAEPGLEHIDSAGETVRSWKSSSMGMYGANISRSKPTPYNHHNHQHNTTCNGALHFLCCVAWYTVSHLGLLCGCSTSWTHLLYLCIKVCLGLHIHGK